MSIRVSNIRLGIDESEHAVRQRAARALGVLDSDIRRWRILRKSLDARNKADLHFIYAAEVVLSKDEPLVVSRLSGGREGIAAELYHEAPFELPPPGSEPLAQRPVVVGSGPAGMAAAYFLAEAGYRPLVLERGQSVRTRVRDVQAFDAGGPLDPESNYLFGEGGAGTFSDGKLTCRSAGPDVQRILRLFADCKGKPSILYDYRPHLGSNRLPAVVKALRQRTEQAGGEFRFACRVEDLDTSQGRLRGVITSSGYIPCSLLVLAIGHSARDTYEMLLSRGVPMVQKPFQFGVRIEQPQEQVNRAQYGPAKLEEKLGAADYSLIARGQPNVFSFCMCAGGQVIASACEPGYFSTNGMSLSRRASPYANSGMMVTLEPTDFGSSHVLAGVALQRQYEGRAFEIGRGEYASPIQWAGDFLAHRASHGAIPSSYARAVVPAEVASLVPPVIAQALHDGLPRLDRRWRGRFLASATLVGPEARGSSPVRFPRSADTLESAGLSGLYPIGEGAGYAGGIVSAALDGLRAAKAIIARYAPLERR
ncbi:MAG: FAD-binding protein [Planctomycetia bacterium]|nr:FAD-binding protein [Planctomycetia bacterium]